MFSMVRKALCVPGFVILIAAHVYGFLAYFVYDTDQATGVMYDGLGRTLSQSPWVMRWLFKQDRLWAGWGWCLADVAIYFGGCVVAIGLFVVALRGDDEKPGEELET